MKQLKKKASFAFKGSVKGLQARCWNSMRELKKFSINELLSIHAGPGEKDAFSSLRSYLNRLARHGVLVRLTRRAPGSTARMDHGNVQWLLVHDLGWHPPIWRQIDKVLINRNTGEIVPLPAQPGAAT